MSNSSEKSYKSAKSGSDGGEVMKKSSPVKASLAVKYGLGKRKSDGADSETQLKSTKIETSNNIPVVKPVKMALGIKKPLEAVAPVQRKKVTVADAFGDDSDSEPEEMPPEAKMRMKNIGRETPTAAGPNSFGKTKIGFCDTQRQFERVLKEATKGTD